MRHARLPTLRLVGILALVLGAALFAAPASAQEAVPERPAAVDAAETTYVVEGTGGAGLALRAGAGLVYPTLAVLPEGSSVRILNGPILDGQNVWYQVQLTGAGTLSGYAHGSYITPRGQAAASAASAQNAAPPAGARLIPAAKVMGYANGADGGAVGSTTASGTQTRWGTLAADVRLYPFGTRVLIQGFEDVVFVVEDTGSGVRGDTFDVWFPDLAAARAFGTRLRQVTVLPPES